jgi:ribosomal protein S18 acetylase RimI-like enzyme
MTTGLFRVYRTDDLDAEIEALDRECFDPSEAYPLKILGHENCWVAESDGRPVGYLVAAGEYLDRYGVLPEYAGQGLGVRLLRAWIRATPGDLWTYTVPTNAASINALIRVGFRSWAPTLYPGTKDFPRKDLCMWRRKAKE